MPLRFYLDVCAFKRPFDDQRQLRIRCEAHAVARLMERAQLGGIALVRSVAHDLENEANPREDRRLAVEAWLATAERVGYDEGTEVRAVELEALGFGVLDAVHLAYAEQAAVDWFVTCDDRLLAAARRAGGRLRVVVVDPCDPRLEGTEAR